MKRQRKLGAEFFVTGNTILRDSQYLRIGTREFRIKILEVITLGCAAGRIIPRVEIQHQVLFSKISKGDGFTAGRRQFECGGFFPNLGLAHGSVSVCCGANMITPARALLSKARPASTIASAVS